jgi:hypothetical protein
MKHSQTCRLTLAPAALIASSLLSPQLLAHHSTAEYDNSSIIEARGEVVSVLWRNPHVRFQISTESTDGNSEPWELEGTDVTRLDRLGVPHDLIRVGDLVSFAGNPSTRSERRMYVTNMLLPDGREAILRGRAEPRWAEERLVGATQDVPEPPSTVPTFDGEFIGKVLSPTRGPAPAWLSNPPLTDAAREGQAAYDAVTDDPVLGCVSPGMPRVMTRSGPYAIRIVERDGDLILQNEWFEIDRLIHMDGRPRAADTPYTPLGYSVGTWEGDTLVVTTTHIDWPFFQLYGLEGVPQSRSMRFVERFTPDVDSAELVYDISATDPAAFTETVTYEAYVRFRWEPGLEFLPYDCLEEELSPVQKRGG